MCSDGRGMGGGGSTVREVALAVVHTHWCLSECFCLCFEQAFPCLNIAALQTRQVFFASAMGPEVV